MTNDEARPNDPDQPQRKLSPELAYFDSSGAGAIESSFISADRHEEGLAQMYLYRRVETGYSIGAFLIDLAGAGIVDFFTNSSMTREHYESALQENWHASDLVPMKPCQAAKVLQMSLNESNAGGCLPDGVAAIAAVFLGGLTAEDNDTDTIAENVIEVLSQLTPPPERGPSSQQADNLSAEAVDRILKQIRKQGLTGPDEPPVQ